MSDAESPGPELPAGFDDAPEAVQVALLETYQGNELVAGICDELDLEPPRGGQLQKRHKAQVLLRLRKQRQRETVADCLRDDIAAYADGDLAKEFAAVVEHDQDTDTDAPLEADNEEAPQPAAVGDGGSTAAVQDAPDTVTAVEPSAETASEPDDGDDLVAACPECDGTGQVNKRKTKPDEVRWKCYACDTAFPEPNRRPRKASHTGHDGDTAPRPAWLARDPTNIVADANMSRDLADVIAAVSGEDTVLQVMTRLGYQNGPNSLREHLLQPLGLLASDGSLADDDTLDERLATLGEWVDE